MPRDPDLFAILQGYGIPPGPFASLLHQAVVENWTIEELLGRLYGSPEFKTMFPGIFGPAGELIMSPGEYLAARREYQHVASIYGFHLSNEDFGRLVAGNVSAQEFTDRLEAAARIRENPQFLGAFRHFAREAGMKNFSVEHAFDAMLGLAPKKFYDIWERTTIKATAKLSGVKLRDQMVEKIRKLSPGLLTEEEIKPKFEELARQIRSLLPLSRIYKFGITKSDLIQLEFGGPRQAEVAERVQRVLATLDAFRAGDRVRTVLQPTTAGGAVALGGQRERPQVQ